MSTISPSTMHSSERTIGPASGRGSSPRMRTALLNYGFRPFFLAAGLAAALLIPWWAGSFVSGVPSLAFAAFWLHALTIGAVTTMILAVMTRASLGHTGRPLVVAPPIAFAYLLLSAAAVVRVFAAPFGLAYPTVIVVAAALWTLGFALFLWVYAPILWTPRVDGKPG